MNKLVLLFASVYLSLSFNAQSWCAPGAVWHYTLTDNFSNTKGYSELRYVDTLWIEGRLCQKITYRRIGTWGSGAPMPAATRTIYTHIENGVIMNRSGPQRFDTIVNFNLPIGKGWTLSNPFNCPNPYPANQQVTIIDKGDTLLNGFNLKYVKVAHGDSATVFGMNWPGRMIIERIGPISDFMYLYPWACSEQTDSWPFEGKFSCYRDNNFGLFSLFEDECIVNLVSLAENEMQRPFKVLPNPTNGEFSIDTKGQTHIRIFNVMGNQVFEQKFEKAGEHKIALVNAVMGIYFIESISVQGVYVSRLLVE